MSQYSTFAKLSLPRRISDIERELNAYKATQVYEIGQIKSRVAQSGEIRSSADQWDTQKVSGKVRFVGVNKNKLARGSISHTVIIDDSSKSSLFRLVCVPQQTTDQPSNVMEWLVYASVLGIPVPFAPRTGPVGTSPFTITFIVNANMSGVVNYVAN